MVRGWIIVGIDWTVAVGLFLAVSVLVLWVTGRLLPLVGGRRRRKG